ncbi:MAG: endonuclease/exonuclease/phosphatase family protein [Cyanobacteria bacterium]|nr:endonuclease/exonuclease/phosphatase family protein [Cyanobacteriota bacterium]
MDDNVSENVESRWLSQRTVNTVIAIWWPFVGISMVFTIIGAIGLHQYVPDLFCHFFVQYLIVQLPFFICLALARRKLEAIAVFLTMVILLVQIAPLFIPESPPQQGTGNRTTIKLLQLNVNSKNKRSDLVIDCVKRYQPDVVLFEEVNGRWLTELTKGLTPQYQVVEGRAQEDNFGIVMFASVPKVESRLITLGYFKVPAILAIFDKNGEKFTIFGVHVLPPHSESNFTDRNLAYDEMAMIRKKCPRSFILMGDLNSTTWSPYFKELLSDSQLKDSSRGHGWQPTWPMQLPFLGLDLEHCLISPNLAVMKREPGSAVGSDHLPLYVELETRTADEKAAGPSK